ncbi:MAG: hypothetical protein NT007_14265 [Candidatus Kapabacteria bacterium]|nr:hypothetical protein [Candidatus Kapabacteria bacterium]
MKKLILIIFVVISKINLLASDFPFNIERLSSDFNGSVFNEKSLIVYGTGSVILRSSDWGKNWEQSHLLIDSVDIIKINYSDKLFIGACDRDYLISSDDEGKNWVLHPLKDKNKISDCVVCSDSIFVLLDRQIEIFNKDFKLIDSIYLPNNNFNEIIIKDIQLLAGNDSLIFIYNLKTKSSTIRENKNIGLCDSCGKVHHFKKDSSNIYVLQNSNLYFSSNDGIQWNLKANVISNYNCFDDDIFNITFDIFDQNSFAELINFQKIKNNKASRISIDKPERYFSKVVISEFNFKNKDTIICVGSDNFINISYNGGKNWNLISNFPINYGHYIQIVNDSLFFAINTYGQVFHTINKGITWKTQYYAPNYLMYPSSYYFNNKGYGFIFEGNVISNIPNTMFTNDFGDHFKLVIDDQFYYNTNISYPIKTSNSDFGINIMVQGTYLSNKYTYIYKYNDSLVYHNSFNYYDSLWITSYQDLGNGKFIGTAYEQKQPCDSQFVVKNFWIVRSNDYGFTWEKDFIFLQGAQFQYFNYFSDFGLATIYFSNKIYKKYYVKIDFVKKITEFLNYDSLTCPTNIIKLKNKSYYLLNKGIFELNDSNSVIHYIKFGSDSYSFFGLLNASTNSIFIFATDSKNRTCFLKLTPKASTPVTETPLSSNFAYFYSFPPYPNPALNHTGIIISICLMLISLFIIIWASLLKAVAV